MRWLREIRACLIQGLMVTLARPRNTLLTVAGFLIAAGTLLGLLTIPAGLERLAGHTGLPDVAVVLSGNYASEASGGMTKAEQLALLGNLPGVAHDPAGHALVAPQFVVSVKLRRPDGTQSDIMVRGVTPEFWQVLGKSVQLEHGRMFKAGVHELVAGAGAAHDFVSLGSGAHTVLRGAPWRVTGTLTAGGGLWESELWTSIGALQDAWNAPGGISAVWVKLTSPAAFDRFNATLQSNPGLKGMHAQLQPDYYRWQVGFIYRYATIAALGISVVLGLGAILAIANALGMALTARRRETAILRAVGFRRSALASALLLEVIVVALACACIAVGLGWLLLDGRGVASATFFQSINFSLRVGATVAALTIAYTVALGIIAAAWPVFRAVRAPLTRALQDE